MIMLRPAQRSIKTPFGNLHHPIFQEFFGDFIFQNHQYEGALVINPGQHCRFQRFIWGRPNILKDVQAMIMII